MRQLKLFRFLLCYKRKWGLGQSPNAQIKTKAAHHIRKQSGEAKNLERSSNQQPKQAKPHFGQQEQSKKFSKSKTLGST